MTTAGRATATAVALLFVAACTGSDATSESTPVETAPSSSPVPDTQADPSTDDVDEPTPTSSTSSTSSVPTTAETDTVETSSSVAPSTLQPSTSPPPVGATSECGASSPAARLDGPSVELQQVGTFDGGAVFAAQYPVPDDLGAPWSQWGQGVVLPDGRLVSGVGDHRGADGRSWFYEYDPATRSLAQTTEVGQALGHQQGDWGYGKLHAPMVLDACDRVVTATYWGSRRGLKLGGSYSGDHLIRYDPSTRDVTSLGVPVEGFGLPSLAISPDRSTLFVEAVDPVSDPDAGVFLTVDAITGGVVQSDDSSDHTGFRDVLVTPEGDGLYAAGNGLAGLSATGSPISEDGVFGGESWFRSASLPAADGSVAISTRSPDELWVRDADGEFRDLGAFDAYVASLVLTEDGTTTYFVPGAHGNGAEFGTPLIAADTTTGRQQVVVRLNDLIEPALGIRVGGSYNVVLDEARGLVYVGLNGGDADGDEAFGDVVLAVVEVD